MIVCALFNPPQSSGYQHPSEDLHELPKINAETESVHMCGEMNFYEMIWKSTASSHFDEVSIVGLFEDGLYCQAADFST